ncbi:MAG: serine protease [Galbibacter orientalis]|uniref:S1 family peptidase n=1 Tax=Galbibacter orientalis TaxID=453852 RepID=UPI00300212E6
MKKNIIILLYLLISSSIYSQNNMYLGSKEIAKKRIDKIKRATGKIFVDGNKAGTGFYASSDGIIITNWHVVFGNHTKIDTVTGEIHSKFTFVDYKNDTIPLHILTDISRNEAVTNSLIWDYCVLKTATVNNTEFLKLGNFSDLYEGAAVYTCGYPLDLHDPFISNGMVSTITSQVVHKELNYKRNISWVDMTMNKGNSGGALMLMGDTPEDDLVVGITSFIITPEYNSLLELDEYVSSMEKKGTVELMGINFLQYIKFISSVVNSNSVGISGAISIEEAKKDLDSNGFNK